MDPGELRDRVIFASRQSASDGYGNAEGAWTDEFTVWAKILPLRHGGESVMAARLDGTQPYVVVVRYSTDSRRITTDWQVRDVNNAARVFNIRSVTPDDHHAFIDILCELGVAT